MRRFRPSPMTMNVVVVRRAVVLVRRVRLRLHVLSVPAPVMKSAVVA